MDENNDGKITWDEVCKAFPSMANNEEQKADFDKADTNKDGVIDRVEFKARLV